VKEVPKAAEMPNEQNSPGKTWEVLRNSSAALSFEAFFADLQVRDL